LARQSYERYDQLVQTNAISQVDYDRVSEAYEAAQAMLVVRQNELELLEAGTREEELRQARAALEESEQALQMAAAGFRPEEVAAAKASRDAAKATLDALQRQQEELTVVSPLVGIVDSLDLSAFPSTATPSWISREEPPSSLGKLSLHPATCKRRRSDRSKCIALRWRWKVMWDRCSQA
jgi:hypothetical protein